RSDDNDGGQHNIGQREQRGHGPDDTRVSSARPAVRQVQPHRRKVAAHRVRRDYVGPVVDPVNKLSIPTRWYSSPSTVLNMLSTALGYPPKSFEGWSVDRNRSSSNPNPEFSQSFREIRPIR